MDDSYELIGRILAHLVEHGLRRQNLSPSVIWQDYDGEVAGPNERLHLFMDVMSWLESEGLITRRSLTMNGGWIGVQLTSRGIAAAEDKRFLSREQKSVREVVSEGPKGDLGADNYGRIGSFIGGLMGGFVQSSQ